MPPCHHWSWSSTYEASDHLITRNTSSLSPAHEERRHVELGGQVGILARPDLPAVEGHEQDALGGADMEDHPAIVPSGRQPERAPVTRRVRLRQVRGAVRPGHLDVGVVRQVAVPCRVQSPGTSISRQPSRAGSASGVGNNWKSHRPSSGKRSGCEIRASGVGRRRSSWGRARAGSSVDRGTSRDPSAGRRRCRLEDASGEAPSAVVGADLEDPRRQTGPRRVSGKDRAPKVADGVVMDEIDGAAPEPAAGQAGSDHARDRPGAPTSASIAGVLISKSSRIDA